MQDQWMREGKGFLLVYNITARNTFDEVSTLYDKILRSKDKDKVPMYVLLLWSKKKRTVSYSIVTISVLVGNKCDLVNERDVQTSEGEELAQQWGCPFFEASAKEKINNEECFYQVVREIRKMEKKTPSKSGGKNKLKCTLL
jgi:GTPase KRas